MMTHTNHDEEEGADFERKASNLDAKRKEEVNWECIFETFNFVCKPIN